MTKSAGQLRTFGLIVFEKWFLPQTSIDLSSSLHISTAAAVWRLNVVKCNFSKVLQYMSKTCLWLWSWCQDILTLDMLIPPIEIKTSICAASKRWGPFPKWGTVMIFRGTIIASCISGPKYPLHGFPFHFWVIAPPTNLEKKRGGYPIYQSWFYFTEIVILWIPLKFRLV